MLAHAFLRAASHLFIWTDFWCVGPLTQASDAKTIVGMLKATGGAGLNGDSIPFVPREFWDESVGQGHPLALQAEGDTNDPALNWSTLGWGYGNFDIIPVHLTRVCQPSHHLTCAVRYVLLSAHPDRVLIGACNPMA